MPPKTKRSSSRGPSLPREARDAANEKIIADPRMAELIDPANPIFDAERMSHGGFRTLVRWAKSARNGG